MVARHIKGLSKQRLHILYVDYIESKKLCKKSCYIPESKRTKSEVGYSVFEL